MLRPNPPPPPPVLFDQSLNQQIQSNTAVSMVNIPNKGAESKKAHQIKREEKVKLDKEAHQDAKQNVKFNPC